MWLTRRQCLARAAGLAALAQMRPAGAAGTAAAGRSSVELLALRGFDAVSYFLPDGPRSGLPAYELSWRGRVWRFAGVSNREIFRRDPEVYAPRLGGFDPAGILEDRLVDTDGTVFAVIGGRLYLFRTAQTRDLALAEPGLAGRAEARWPSLSRLDDAVPPD